MSARKRKFYQADWFWWLFFAALLSPFVIRFGTTWWEIKRHRWVQERIELAILRLSLECPEELSESQWAYCITWTWIMQGNFGSTHTSVPTDELDRIADELNRRIDRGADLATIDWIWNQYMVAYPRVAAYNHWRPTSTENQETFADLKDDIPTHDDSSESSLAFWRERYREKLAETEDR